MYYIDTDSDSTHTIPRRPENMIKRYLKYLLIIPIFLLVVASMIRLGLNYSGYCYEQGRYLSDQEKIEIAVSHIIRFYPPAVDLYEKENGQLIFVDQTIPEKAIEYDSITEFFSVNQGCCEITNHGKKGYQIPLSYKLYGSLSDFVRVRYLVRYEDSDGDIISLQEEPYVAISNCGYPWSGI